MAGENPNNPLGQEPPPIETGDNPNTPSSGDASQMSSQWVSGTLRDSKFYREFIAGVETIRQAIWDAFSALIEVLDIIVSLLEIIKTLLMLIDGLIQIAVKAVIALLQELKDAFIQWLNDMLGIGFYFLPHFLAYDWKRVIREVLLNPYGAMSGTDSSTSQFNPGQIIPVPSITSPGRFDYRTVEAPQKRGMGYDQFIKDVEKAFKNKSDRLRPTFSQYMPVSGVIIALAFDDIFVFFRIVCFLLQLISGKNYGFTFAKKVANWIYPELAKAQAEGYGSPEAIESAMLFLQDSDSGLDAIIKGISGQGGDTITCEQLTIKVNAPSQFIDDATSSSFAAYGYSSSGTTPIDFNTGVSAGLLGNFRGPFFNYDINVQIRNSTNGALLYAQCMRGSSFAYANSRTVKPLSLPSKQVILQSHPIGILIGECKEGPNSFNKLCAPLHSSGCSDPTLFNGSMVEKEEGTCFKWTLNQGTPADVGKWWIHPPSGKVYLRNSDGTPLPFGETDLYIFTVVDKDNQDNVLMQVYIYAVRFKLENESVTIGSGTNTIIGYYSYDDYYSMGSRVNVGLHHSDIYQLSFEQGIPQSEVENRLGFPMSMGSGGGKFNFAAGGLSDITKRAVISMDITLPTSVNPDGDWYVIYNHKVALHGGAEIFSGDFWTSFYNTYSKEGSKSKVTLASVDLNDDLSALEVCSASQKDVVPAFSTAGTSGGSFAAVTVSVFSKIITYVFDRNPPISMITLLTPMAVSPQQVDDMFIARISAMAKSGDTSSNFNAMLEGLFGKGWDSSMSSMSSSASWYSDLFKSQNVEFLGRVYWRGYKPKGMGIIVWDVGQSIPVSVLPPDQTNYFWDQNPTLLKVGNYQYEIYGYDQGVFNTNGGKIDSIFSAVTGMSPKMLKGGQITDVVTHNITVDDQIDIRDFPGGLSWQTISLKRWINIVDPLDRFLQALIDSIPVPPSIFQPLINWISRTEARIQYWEAVIKAIQEYIDRILRLLDIGDTGFYFLAINSAAGSDGFVSRMKKVQAPLELTGRPFCTGIVMVAATDYGGQQLIDFLFDWCPSAPLPGEKIPPRPSANDIASSWYDKLQEDSQKLIDEANVALANDTASINANYADIKERLSNISNHESDKVMDPSTKDEMKKLQIPSFFKKFGE